MIEVDAKDPFWLLKVPVKSGQPVPIHLSKHRKPS